MCSSDLLIKNKLFFGIDLLLYEPALEMLLAVAEFFSLVNKNDVYRERVGLIFYSLIYIQL